LCLPAQKLAMKSSTFDTLSLDAATADAIAHLHAAPQGTAFSDLVKSCGVDIAKELQYANFSDADLSNSDLRNFNFRGADLRGVVGVNVRWDSSTVLTGASLDGSIFASKTRLDEFFAKNQRAKTILDHLRRQGWSDQMIWIGESWLQRSLNRDIARAITEALLESSKDNGVRIEAMNQIASDLSAAQYKELALAALSNSGDKGYVVLVILDNLRRRGLGDDPTIRRMATALIGSSSQAVQIEAMKFLFLAKTLKRTELDVMLAAGSQNNVLGTHYVSHIAERLGGMYPTCVRDPLTNQPFGFRDVIDEKTLNLIALNWIRAIEKQRLNGRSTLGPTVEKTRHFRSIVLRNLVILRGYGITLLSPDLAEEALGAMDPRIVGKQGGAFREPIGQELPHESV